MMQLTKNCFNQACESIIRYGRPLEKAMLQKCFFNGPIDDVLTELKEFQNEDGGFGNGLESDFRLPYSSPMATSVGLRILSEIDVHIESKEIIKKAIDYLEKSYNKDRNGWFAVSEEVNNFPHAPWWHYDYEKGMTVIDRSWGNPSAEILAYIYKYREYVKDLNIDRLVQNAIEYIENKQEFESEHELYCYIKLYDILPEELQKRLESRLSYAIAQVIIYDENKWLEYVPTPLDFVKSQESNKLGILETKINNNIDFIIKQLETYGKIIPPWGMSFYNEDLKEAYDEWIGVITLKALITLDRFDRILV